MPFLGIWKQKNAPFICIEPWAGFADKIDTSGKLEEKGGITKLNQGEEKIFSWSLFL